MIKGIAVLLGAGLLIVAAQAKEKPAESVPTLEPRSDAPFEASVWAASSVPAPQVESVSADPDVAEPEVSAETAIPLSDSDYDVVDAHWMAMTMWGEARGAGEEAMRAVGHVIDNRRRAGGRYGDHATNTVSAAWQFSCWNPGDPNRRALDRIGSLGPDGRDQLMWSAARRMAAEILAGRSVDPTGGALFYHTEAVAPAWSRGLAPIAKIGPHLFFAKAV